MTAGTRTTALAAMLAIGTFAVMLGSATVSPVMAQTASSSRLIEQQRCVAALEAYAAKIGGTDKARYYAVLDAALNDLARALEETPAYETLTCPEPTTSTFVRRSVAVSSEALPGIPRQERVEARLQDYNRRVYGGWAVPPSHLPAVVAITARTGEICSGTLIGPRTVVTAAHCFCLRADGQIDSGGEVHIGEVTSSPRQSIAIARVELMTPNFCRTMNANGIPPGEDLALAHLAADAVLARQDLAQLMNFTEQYLSFAPTSMAVVGFGLTEENRIGQKRYARVGVQSHLCSGEAARRFYCKPGREAVLADTSGRQSDTCRGDSGGPVYYIAGPDDDPRWYLAAVTSRAATDDINRATGEQCGYGGVYTLLGPPAIRWLCSRTRGFSVFADGNPCGG